jgi:hypothetical protein
LDKARVAPRNRVLVDDQVVAAFAPDAQRLTQRYGVADWQAGARGIDDLEACCSFCVRCPA